MARALRYPRHNIPLIMKTSLMILASLSSLALVLALAFSGDAFAELAGLHVPAVLNVENTLALFTATFALLILIAEYRPRVSTLPLRSGRNQETGPAVLSLLAEEAAVGLCSPEYYAAFADRVDALGKELRAMLTDLRSQGHTVAAYGAAAKGAVLLNAFDIGPDLISFVADRSPHKQGFLMPGVHIPIVEPEQLVIRKPDECLLLAWNFADEILAQQAEYRRLGGRFIIPGPKLTLV